MYPSPGDGGANRPRGERSPEAGRSGLPQRHFRVTPAGIDALRRSRAALLLLWRDLDTLLDLP